VLEQQRKQLTLEKENQLVDWDWSKISSKMTQKGGLIHRFAIGESIFF
jgi:hypothetical protein